MARLLVVLCEEAVLFVNDQANDDLIVIILSWPLLFNIIWLLLT